MFNIGGGLHRLCGRIERKEIVCLSRALWLSLDIHDQGREDLLKGLSGRKGHACIEFIMLSPCMLAVGCALHCCI